MISWTALLLTLWAIHIPEEPIPTAALDGAWGFRQGDDMAWAAPAPRGEGWQRVVVPGPLERVAPGYDGYAWYRREVALPAAVAEGPVGLRMGSVGDAFEVYWNGVRIGGRGSFPPEFREGVTPALLLVSEAALAARQGEQHVLAVRVYNHYAYGGLLGGARVGRYDVLAQQGHPGEMVIGGLIVFFLAIGAYHLAFYVRRREARENLYFALLCGLAALYGATFSVVFAEVAIEHVNPYRLGLLAMLAGGPAYLGLLSHLFDLRAGRISRAAMLLFAAAFVAAATLPLPVLAHVHPVASMLVGVGLSAAALWVVSRGMRQGREWWVLALGAATFTAAMGWDLLSGYELVPVARVLPGVPGAFWVGFLAFMGAVGVQTASRYARAEVDARIDTLTGLTRRHVFEEAVGREAERRRRAGGTLVLVVLDLDRFKQVNDTYGHRAGDMVLQRVGHLLQHASRNIDLIARLGGEEFAVLLCDTDLDGAMRFTERFRQRLRELRVEVPGGEVADLTVSAGVVASAGWSTSDDLLDAADRAMYRAKEAGRDRVVVADTPLLGMRGAAG